MKTKINKMSAKQAAYLPAYRAEWIKNGESTERHSIDEIRAVVTDLYVATGFPEPKVVVMDSPFGCLVARALFVSLGDNLWDNLRVNLDVDLWDNLRVNLDADLWDNLRVNLDADLWDNLRVNLGVNLGDNLWDNLGDNLWDNLRVNLDADLWDNLKVNLRAKLGADLRNNLFDRASLWGHHDTGWLAFYDFPRTLGHSYNEEDTRQLDATIAYARMCGWLYAYQGMAFVSQKQSELHRDAQGRLHSETRPAMAFADGYGFHAWHGIRVPRWCIEQKDLITKETILAESNTEIRRAMCEIVGWAKAIDMFGGHTIDDDECLGLPRTLIETTIEGEKVRLLRMTNGTVENGVRRQFIEGVPLTVNTCHEAVAWQCGVPATIHNEGVRT